MEQHRRERQRRQSGKRANRTVFWRTVVLMGIFGVALFIPLFWKLYQLQIVQHDELQEKAIRQQTSDLTVSASRGTIYDRNGNTLAISATVYDVILSPKAILGLQEDYADAVEDGKTPDYPEPTAEFIADHLVEILGVDREDVLERMTKVNRQYERVAQKIEGEQEEALRAFISENHLSGGIYLNPTTKRYYPNSQLAAQVIGFVNDAGGAYGVESKYEEQLRGTAGRVVTAQNAAGTDLLDFFQDYYDAQDGYDLTLTLDKTIQSYCERVLAEGIEQYDVENGGFCIAMDPNTGAILGMASSPNYDLNNYAQVVDQELQKTLEGLEGDAYQEAVAAARNLQWRNKAITDSYEPGSTFKSIVLAAALQEGVVSASDTFTCTGSIRVDGYPTPIRCSNRSGHGTQTLAEAVGNSCNPAFITIGQRLGEETFYDYLEAFGFLEKTGIDLPGEQTPAVGAGKTIWDRSGFGWVDLAVASFGQRFQTTPIRLISAVAATINGGYLYTPYVVQTITDQGGNVVQNTEPEVVRQVISEETSQQVAMMLENVVDGCISGKPLTGKNAYVAGYRIGGKTGTSETLVDGEYIVSFIGFAPADDPQVIVLLAYDTPTPQENNPNYSTTGYYISGGQMAAPKVGGLLADILDYLGVEKVYGADEVNARDTTVPNVAGLTLAEAAQALEGKNLEYRKVGSGDTVTGQIPAANASIPENSQVILYLGETAPTDPAVMPNLTGQTLTEARETLSQLGLYLKASGATTYASETTRVSGQSVEAGSQVARGTVIDVQFSDGDVDDAYVALD